MPLKIHSWLRANEVGFSRENRAVKRLTILISGAGIAGPALAYWLLQRGFAPVMVERAPAFREGGYMIDFWGVGWKVAKRGGDLAKAIFDLIADKVEVHFGDSISAIDQREENLEVAFVKAPPRKFDLVIGCDGLHSVVRDAVFAPEETNWSGPREIIAPLFALMKNASALSSSANNNPRHSSRAASRRAPAWDYLRAIRCSTSLHSSGQSPTSSSGVS